MVLIALGDSNGKPRTADGWFLYTGTHIKWVQSGHTLDLLRTRQLEEWLVYEVQLRAVIAETDKVGPSPTSGAFKGAW
jgi:hypothetical protein